jgi:indolepyruvate ferredoxin oxidoreductase
LAVDVISAAGLPVTLADRYLLQSGTVQLTGIQALVRAVIDRRRADAAAGFDTAAFVSGYPGSPLGGLDQELAGNRALLDEQRIVHVPGQNEELAATAVWGSQVASHFGSRLDGVLGVWYGKNPGLDRATDALRHANWIGTGSRSGGLVIVGDDPAAKSSSIPNTSEMALADLGMPTFYPANVADILRLAAEAIRLSRATGLLSALKIVTNVADSSQTVRLDEIAACVMSADLGPGYRPMLLSPGNTAALERSLHERLGAVAALLCRDHLNRWHGDPRAWLGVVAAGKPYLDLVQAFRELGITDLASVGVRVLKLDVIWPLDRARVAEFAAGLSEILVVEEKRPFIEEHLRAALYGLPGAPAITGKYDEHGAPLVPSAGETDAAVLAPVLVSRLSQRIDAGRFRQSTARLAGLAGRPLPVLASRPPAFCSGCPHSRSTDVPDPGAIVGAGTGCHAIVLFDRTGAKGRVDLVTQMGGEGAQWVGVAPFAADQQHFVQNMGDGTFYHSGQLAIRFAVAAGLRCTFKILVNNAVAMTGGQDVVGATSVALLTRTLEADGVRRTVVTADDPARYRGVRLAGNAVFRARNRLGDAQVELAREPGVTVVVHDQQCAAERRRLRKRGLAAPAPFRVVINERVCEGCGDCGRKSGGCMSLRTVDTEFGAKTQIHDPSCNADYSCLEGDCPAFITVRGTPEPARVRYPAIDLPEPDTGLSSPVRIRMAGIGGLGVVTASQIVAMATMLDGHVALGVDQTGLAQKGGVVVSDLLLSAESRPAPMRGEVGGVDVLLAFDLVAATQPASLQGVDPARTVWVAASSAVPTAGMTGRPDAPALPVESMLRLVQDSAGRPPAALLDAATLARRLFADDMPASIIAVGTAFQLGLIPVSGRSMADALRLHAANAEVNLAAFAWGRAAAVDASYVETATAYPAAAETATGGEPGSEPLPGWPHPGWPLPGWPLPGWLGERAEAAGFPESLARCVAIRADDLAGYQNRRYAADYVAFVEQAYRAAGRDIAEVVATQLHRLMAYKDEYEVARLHLLGTERARATAGLRPGARVYWHLHPPLLRSLGRKNKIAVGPAFAPVFRVLHAARALRGTPIDVFGMTRMRRAERALIPEYRQLAERALTVLTPDNRELVAELLGAAGQIRGYESIKEASMARYRERVEDLWNRLRSE